MPQAKDIAGEISGTLTAVRFDGHSANGRRLWLCRCECGGTVRVTVSDFRKQKSCSRECPAVLRFWAGAEPQKLEGETFGRLRVVRLYHCNRHGNRTWLCECECGNQLVTTGAHLSSGDTQSCGCLQRERSATAARRVHIRRCAGCGRAIRGGAAKMRCRDCAAQLAQMHLIAKRRDQD